MEYDNNRSNQGRYDDNRYQTGYGDDRNYSRGGYGGNEGQYGSQGYGRQENQYGNRQGNQFRNQYREDQYRDDRGRFNTGYNEYRGGSREYGGYNEGRADEHRMHRGQEIQGYSNYQSGTGRRRSQSGSQYRSWTNPYGSGSYPQGKDDEGLRKLLVEQLKDMLWAEKALTKAIPKMIRKATSDELIEALTEHEQVTEMHVQKVKQAFELLGEKASPKPCEAMKGLIKEAEELMEEMEDGSLLDAAIICAAQKVEHYEIGTYGCLATYAEILQEDEVADLMKEILGDEKEADETLTQVAYGINWEAVDEDDDDDDDEEEADDDEDEEDADDEEDDAEDEEDEEEEDDDITATGAKKPGTQSGKKRQPSELEVVES